MNDLIPREKIAGWEQLKTLALDSVSSPKNARLQYGARRVHGLVQQEARRGFTKATMSAWRAR